jgi:hypothetical protein
MTKQSILEHCLKIQIKNIGLIAINATIVLKWWCPEYILATDGVHTVHTKNYVKMLNVNHVLKTHLLHMKNQNIYTTKQSIHGQYSKTPIKNSCLIVINANISLKQDY